MVAAGLANVDTALIRFEARAIEFASPAVHASTYPGPRILVTHRSYEKIKR